MALTPYQRGAAMENRIVRKAKEHGKLAMRSAGSHGEVDVIIFDPVTRIIEIIQCKGISSRLKSGELDAEHRRILDRLRLWEGHWEVKARLQTRKKYTKHEKSDKEASLP